MHEVLFVYSPVTITLSVVTIILAFFFPAMMGQKLKVRHLPLPIQLFVWVIIVWNTLDIIGTIFFSGPEFSIAREIIFGAKAIFWIQAGTAIAKFAEINLHRKRNFNWNIFNGLGCLSVIAITFLFCSNPETITHIHIAGHTPFANHPHFILFTILFIVFVLPGFLTTVYYFLRSCFSANDSSLAQIQAYMLGSLVFIFSLACFMDFVIPFACNFSIGGKPVHFMLWSQYTCLFVAIISGQYFTSISFKNQSFNWLVGKIFEHTDDCVFAVDSKGTIIRTNPASTALFQMQDSEILSKKIWDFLPSTMELKETFLRDVEIQIRSEAHHFNVGIYPVRISMTATIYIIVLTDHSNTLFYEQRIKNLSQQFANYKQDLIRYQDRLTSSQKKFDENTNFLATLINALPFQFWSKNEQGVYMTQNQKDINKRGYLILTTSDKEVITEYEKKAREEGEPTAFITYEIDKDVEISEEEANTRIKKGENVFIYQNFFYPIISKQPPFKIIGLKLDMTEQRKLENERNYLQEQKNIHSRLEELGTLCGAFAHDYNNIIGSQIGFCQLASEMLEIAKEASEQEGVKSNISVASNFVNEASKAAQNGKKSLEELLNTIRGKTQTAADNVEFFPYMIVEDVKKKVVLTLPPNISIVTPHLDKKIKIKGQPASLDRILSNMANNAVFAMKETGGALTLKLERATLETELVTPHAAPIPPGDYAKFSIIDTGTGMDSGTLERIFSPFFTTKAPGEGLGLGLSSALRLLKEGNAYFTVETTLGKGTQFNLYFSVYKE